MTNSSSSSPSFVSPTFCAAQRDPAFNSHRPFSGPQRGQATWPTWIAVDVWSGGGEGAGGAEYHAPAHAQTFSPGEAGRGSRVNQTNELTCTELTFTTNATLWTITNCLLKLIHCGSCVETGTEEATTHTRTA